MIATATPAETARPAASAAPADAAAPPAEMTDGLSGLDVAEIGRLAVHLAALELTVLPVAAARLSDAAPQIAELRRLGRELATALHWLDRHLTGDARTAGSPAHQMAAAARSAAIRRAESELALLSALERILEGSETVELVRAYHRASMTAPTRPHPRLTCRTLRGRLMFMLTARMDAIRDELDNRPVKERAQARAAAALRDLEALPCADEAAPLPSSARAAALPQQAAAFS